MFRKDYSYLEGKIVKYHQTDRDQDSENVVVVGCNYDVGITLLNKEKDMVYMCLCGPCTQTHQTDIKEGNINRRKYNTLFTSIINMIERGDYYASHTLSIYRSMTNNEMRFPTKETCPFNQ